MTKFLLITYYCLFFDIFFFSAKPQGFQESKESSSGPSTADVIASGAVSAVTAGVSAEAQVSSVLSEVHGLVDSVHSMLSSCRSEHADLQVRGWDGLG